MSVYLWNHIEGFVWALAGLDGVLALACAWLFQRCRATSRSLVAAQADADNCRYQLGEIDRAYRMIEDWAQVGLWQYDPVRGRQVWSKGLRQMFGVDPGDEFLPGDGETLLSVNGVDLVAQVMARLGERGGFTLRFAIMRIDGDMRTLSMHAIHLRDSAGRTCRVVGLVSDATERVRQDPTAQGWAQMHRPHNSSTVPASA